MLDHGECSKAVIFQLENPLRIIEGSGPLQERHWLELKRHLFIQNNSHERVCAEAESVPTSAVIHLVVPLGMGRTGLWYGWARRARHKLTNSSAVWCCLVAGLALLATVVSGLSSQP